MKVIPEMCRMLDVNILYRTKRNQENNMVVNKIPFKLMISWTEKKHLIIKIYCSLVKRLRRGCKSQNIPSLQDNMSDEIFITDEDKANHLKYFFIFFNYKY